MINESDIDELQKRRKIKIDEKLKLVNEWRKKYPSVILLKKGIPVNDLRELVTSDEEYKHLRSEYRKIQKYYVYICEKMTTDIIPEEQILEYSNAITELYEKYGIEKAKAKYIIHKFGSIEKFVSKYRNGKLNHDDMMYAINHVKSYIDIDESKYYNNYVKLLKDLYGKTNQITFFSSKAIRRILYSMPKEHRIFIQERYGLNDGKFKTYEKIGELHNITKQGARTRVLNIIEKLRLNESLLKKIFSTKEAECSEVLDGVRKIIDDLKAEIDGSSFAFNGSVDSSIDFSQQFKSIRWIFERDDDGIVDQKEYEDMYKTQQENERKEEYFVYLYRNGELQGNNLKMAEDKIRSYIDVDRNSDSYDKLVEEIYGKTHEITFYSSDEIEKVLQRLKLREQVFIRKRYEIYNFASVSDEQKKYMREKYGTESIEQISLDEIAKKENLRIKEIDFIIKSIIEKTRNDQVSKYKIIPLDRGELYFCSAEQKEIIERLKKQLDKSIFVYKSVKLENDELAKETYQSLFGSDLRIVKNIAESINKKNEELNINISELNLPIRFEHRLIEQGFNTVYELVREIKLQIAQNGTADIFFYRIKGWGEKATNELKHKFEELGIDVLEESKISELESLRMKKDSLRKEANKKRKKVEETKLFLEKFESILEEKKEIK